MNLILNNFTQSVWSFYHSNSKYLKIFPNKTRYIKIFQNRGLTQPNIWYFKIFENLFWTNQDINVFSDIYRYWRYFMKKKVLKQFKYVFLPLQVALFSSLSLFWCWLDFGKCWWLSSFLSLCNSLSL